MSVLVSILMVIVLAVGSVFGFYNGMVSSRENVDSKWSQVDNQLQRRSDLIPNLVNTVKGYASHEKEVFQSVSDARAKMAGAKSVGDKLSANTELSGALSRLLAVAENYPQLKADQNFRQLQVAVMDVEEHLQGERKTVSQLPARTTMTQCRITIQRLNRCPTHYLPGRWDLRSGITLKWKRLPRQFRKCSSDYVHIPERIGILSYSQFLNMAICSRGNGGQYFVADSAETNGFLRYLRTG